MCHLIMARFMKKAHKQKQKFTHACTYTQTYKHTYAQQLVCELNSLTESFFLRSDPFMEAWYEIEQQQERVVKKQKKTMDERDLQR